MSRQRLQSEPQSRQCRKCRARSELEGAAKYMTDKECGPPRETRGADPPSSDTHTHTFKFISFGGEGTIRSRSAVPNLSPPDTTLMCAPPTQPPSSVSPSRGPLALCPPSFLRSSKSLSLPPRCRPKRVPAGRNGLRQHKRKHQETTTGPHNAREEAADRHHLVGHNLSKVSETFHRVK